MEWAFGEASSKLIDEFEELAAEFAAKASSLSKLEEEVACLKSENIQLKTREKQLQNELNALSELVSSFEAKLGQTFDASNEISKLRLQVASLTTSIGKQRLSFEEELSREKQAMQREVDGKKDEIAQWKATTGRLEKEAENLRRELLTHKRAIDDLKAVKEFAEISGREQVAQLNAAHHDKTVELQRAMRQSEASLAQAHENLLKERIKYEERMTQLTARLDAGAAGAVIDSLKKKLMQQKQEIDELKSKLAPQQQRPPQRRPQHEQHGRSL